MIVLRAKEIPFEVTYIDLRNKPGWFLEISPHGKVPVLQVDGEPVNNLQEARLALIPRFVGDRVLLGVWRDGRRVDLEFVLREAVVSR